MTRESQTDKEASGSLSVSQSGNISGEACGHLKDVSGAVERADGLQWH